MIHSPVESLMRFFSLPRTRRSSEKRQAKAIFHGKDLNNLNELCKGTNFTHVISLCCEWKDGQNERETKDERMREFSHSCCVEKQPKSAYCTTIASHITNTRKLSRSPSSPIFQHWIAIKAIESNISGSGIYFPSSHTSRLDVLKNSNAQHVRRLAARREEKKFTKLKKSRKGKNFIKGGVKIFRRKDYPKKRNTKKSQMRKNIN